MSYYLIEKYQIKDNLSIDYPRRNCLRNLRNQILRFKLLPLAVICKQALPVYIRFFVFQGLGLLLVYGPFLYPIPHQIYKRELLINSLGLS